MVITSYLGKWHDMESWVRLWPQYYFWAAPFE